MPGRWARRTSTSWQGFAQGQKAHDCFVSGLGYACDQAGPHGMTILIEPLNRYDAPGYFLADHLAGVAGIIDEVGAANLKLMFDCYHVQLMEGDLSQKAGRPAPADRTYPVCLRSGPGARPTGERSTMPTSSR